MSTNVREFLLRVLPWPGDDTPGFCNMHAMLTMPDGKKPWTGSPTRDVDQFLQIVYTAMGWRTPPDIYMCMSRQADTKPGKDGKIRAAKSSASALALKALWYDVDVGKKDGYATIPDAMQAVLAMCKVEGLPAPTAWVASGGGLHAYWISDRELTPDEWQPYAEGLKALALKHKLLHQGDYGVTTDRARVLRVPGTSNLKIKDTPRPVKLLNIKDHDYDFAARLGVLTTISPLLAATKPQAPVLPGKPPAAFAVVPVESLAEGVTREEFPPVPWQPLLKECGWFTAAVTTGGRDFSQGLWNLSTLAATFMEDGHALAHKMAKGHPGYQYSETEALWERKLLERKNRHLGWPSCRAIQGEGCTACATCPHLAVGKSPLNCATQFLSSVAPNVASGTAPAVVQTPPGSVGTGLVPLTTADMPDPSYAVVNGIIHKIVEVAERGQPPSLVHLPLFQCELFGPWAQSNPDALNFITSVDKGSFRDVHILRTQMRTMELELTLLDHGVMPISANFKYVKEFIMSWLATLNKAAAAHTNVPFGWHIENNVCKGFSYGSVLYKSDGTRGPVGMIDPQLKHIYGPEGDIQPWWDAFHMITAQKRPGLEVIVASAFGAPLMFGSGEYSVLMSVFGESGAGKSSAARVGIAIWAKPVMAKEVETATYKSVIHRLGQIKNIPYYWDEIKNEPAQQKAYDVLYVASAGSEGDRLKANITHQEKGTWQTICGIFSNPSFGNFVLKANPNTTAGLMRLFEWEEKKPGKKDAGQIRPSDAARQLSALDYNFGQMGKLYSAFLGPNRDYLLKLVEDNSHWFEDAVYDPSRNSNDERYWIAFAAATMSGAQVANKHLGTDFDLDAMREFLKRHIIYQRDRSAEENTQGGSLEHTEQMLTQFLKANLKCTVRTNTLPLKRPGVPSPVELVTQTERGMPCHVHWVMDAAELRLSQSELYRYLRRDDVRGDPRSMKDGLKKHFHATVIKDTLAKGTTLRGGPETIITVPVTNPSALWTLMMANPGSAEPVAPAPLTPTAPPPAA